MHVPPLKIHFSETDINSIASDIKHVLRSGQLSLGNMTKRFEDQFSLLTKRKYAVAVNSGTTALEILLRVKDVKGKTVIVQTNTNYATAAAVLFAGGKLKLVDGGIYPSLDDIKNAVDISTVGIIFVHIGGYLSNELDDLKSYCESKGLFLIEDAAHAHGATLKGQPAGNFGHAAAFSFFPTKVITSGEGGMIVTDNKNDYQKILILRDQGKDPVTKQNVAWGNSWRMSELQAVLGFHQLKHLAKFVKRRNEIMKKYASVLGKYNQIRIYTASEHMIPSGYKFIVQFPTAKICQQIKKTLEQEHQVYLGGGVYDIPIHRQPIFKTMFKNKKFPKADHFCTTHLCLPVWSTMTNQEVEYVIKSVEKVFKKEFDFSNTLV
ncbi:MAG: DegT/DnrJ/EryC1/StrS family aminotransferase [Microgenomates group bacterium]|jgi:dTDP-4-amino-4,6-dideoxygalactose transaminase